MSLARRFARFFVAPLAVGFLAFGAALALEGPAPPSILFGDLYRDVETAGLFSDQKTFADATPREPPDVVTAAYAREKNEPGFDLKTFVDRHFALPSLHVEAFERQAGQSVEAYIQEMWAALRRPPDTAQPYSSLLPLAAPYIVPGGRFREIYYWDTYFTLLGLEQDGERALARDMVENIASLIRTYGHMPNGNRSYYLSRSQPPFFSAMVERIAARDGDPALLRYLPEMRTEYDYWTDGAADLAPGEARRRVVRLKDGTILNRYWDDLAAPRDESYSQDVETARRSGRPAPDVYRDLRAGAESGWDFSSRWLADGSTLATIRTTEIVPVDLNALMVHLERTLAKAYALKGDAEQAQTFGKRADDRAAAIRTRMWDPGRGAFVDWLWREGRPSDAVTAATIYPLFFGVASPDEARVVAGTVRTSLLAPGGLRATEVATGQQWDRPNGWAPLQYLAVEGLNAYGERDLAREIAARWLGTVLTDYRARGALVEKYDIERTGGAERGGGGGEYVLQAGFGWTNGVLAQLMADYPDLAAAAR